jgi:hypothetical protein
MPKKKARMGRPPLPKAEGKRHAAGLRMTKDLRLALEAASARTGRSLSQEMEALLEMAVGRLQALPTMLDHAFGFHTSVLLLLIGDLAGAGQELALDWLNDPVRFARMRRKVILLLDLLAPEGQPAVEDAAADDEACLLLLTRLFARAKHPLYRDWARERELRLGDTARERLMLRLEDRS